MLDCEEGFFIGRCPESEGMFGEEKIRKDRSEEGTDHDYHDSFNTPPYSSGSDLFSEPVKPSSDGRIFFGLILSFTTSQS